jgi:hypothetical protein
MSVDVLLGPDPVPVTEQLMLEQAA